MNPVQAPAPVGAPDRALGRLGPALAWLAAAQGAWPPRTPASVRHVRLGEAAGPTGPDLQADPELEIGPDLQADPELEIGPDLETGSAQADELADAGADLVVLSGAGSPVAGIVVVAALLDLEPVHAVGTVAGADWAGLTVGVRSGLRATRDHVFDPVGLLRATASPGLAHATGLLAQCAVRRTPVVLDGSPLVCGAALVAERLAPGAAAWWLAGQAPPNPAAAKALAHLGLAPLLDLHLALPVGADLALAVLLGAVEAVGAARA